MRERAAQPRTQRMARISRAILGSVSVRPIVLLGDPRLRLKGEPVTSFNKFLHGLLDDLTHTMRDAPGVGLAAPQIGEGAGGLRRRGRGSAPRARQPEDRPLRRATTATSRAACRSRATPPTSPVARRSGSSPRIDAAGRSRSPARVCSAARSSTSWTISTASCTSTTSTRWTSSSRSGWATTRRASRPATMAPTRAASGAPKTRTRKPRVKTPALA